MESVKTHVDFISELHGRSMLNVLDVIFSYFNGDTLSDAIFVCKGWRSALSDCGREKFYTRLIQKEIQQCGLWEIIEKHEMVKTLGKEINFSHLWNSISFQAKWAKFGWREPSRSRHYLDIEQTSDVKLDLDMTQFYIVQFDKTTDSFHFWSKVSFNWKKVISAGMYPPEDDPERGVIGSEFQGMFLYVSSGCRIVSMEVATGKLKCHHPFPDWSEGVYVNRLVVQNGFMASSITTKEKGDAVSDLYIWQVGKGFVVDWKLYLRLKDVNLHEMTITVDAKFLVLFHLVEPDRKHCYYDVRKIESPCITFKKFSLFSTEMLYASSSVYVEGFIFYVSENKAINSFELATGLKRCVYSAPWTNISNVLFRSNSDVFYVCGLRDVHAKLFSSIEHDYSLLHVVAWKITDLCSPPPFGYSTSAFPSPQFEIEEIVQTPYSFHIDLSGISIVTENYEKRKIFISQWNFLPLCSFCREPRKKLYRCTSCKSAIYCNRVCQELDWQKHKVVCQDEVGIIRARAILSEVKDDQQRLERFLS